MAVPIAQSSIPTSGQFDFIYGAYRLSEWNIPYFSTTMTLRQAAESLRLVNDLPGAAKLSWRLDELYQRDIDWPRVERQILPYLRSQTQPQFFNSLTVALLPILENQIRDSFGGEGWKPPALENANNFANQLTCGPIRLGYWTQWETLEDPGAKLGHIKWNTVQVFGVAIDGQHRLAAIKQFVDGGGYDNKLEQTHVPVILVVLDPMLGYRSMANKSNVDVLRNLFIDLNKYAKPVSRPRQILLDDKDPHSLCVRSLVGRQILNGDSDFDTSPPRMPLSLVDWHTESAKFDDGPYLTTTLGLDWMVTAIFGVKPILDYTDYGTIRRQIRAISQDLGITLDTALRRLSDLETLGVEPFQYTGGESGEILTGELGEIVSAFQRVWSPAIVHLLSTFSPYQFLLKARRDNESLTTEFVNWYYLYKRMKDEEKRSRSVDRAVEGRATLEYRKFVNELVTRPQDPISVKELQGRLQELEDLKEENLAFKVVFQRALLNAFMEFSKIDFEDLQQIGEVSNILDEDEERVVDDDDEELDQAVDEGSTISERTTIVLERMRQYVAGLNSLVGNKPDLLNHLFTFSEPGEDSERTFWMGSLTDGSNIDFTLGASRRAQELIFIAAALHLVSQVDAVSIAGGFDNFWADLQENESLLYKRMRRSITRYTNERGAAYRILAARDESYSMESALSECKARICWLWNTLGLP